MAAERHDLWTQTAARRAGLAAGQAGELEEQAVRRHAVGALAVFNAAAAGASPLEGLEPPGDEDDWDEPRLAPPPACTRSTSTRGNFTPPQPALR
jgi:hypothetical protein